MRRLLGVLVAAAAVAVAGPVHSGGSYEPVKVRNLRIIGDTQYELVVETPAQSREPGNADPYFSKCPLFTVHGEYSATYAAAHFPESATRKKHVEALTMLKAAQASGRSIHFGWIGTGFVPIDHANLCEVRSRALTTMESPEGNSVVVSFHDAP